MHLAAFGQTETLDTLNVIAESKSGRSDRVVISGAHLDSVPAGPGINDDGSGTATQIEVAQEMAELDLKLRNKVRFIWFSGEEQGLFGSDFNADDLTKAERGNVIAMLDFDMLASPNYALLIYDGDGSEHRDRRPQWLGQYREGLPGLLRCPRPVHRADPLRRPFRLRRIHRCRDPGRRHLHRCRGPQDPAQQQHWGGVVSDDAQRAVRPLLPPGLRQLWTQPGHDNINDEALAIISDAVAHAVLTFAQTTSSTNGTGKASSNATKPFDWHGNKLVR